ncbi:magnesium chelatase subunit ChlI family protein, partial [Parapedobacter sp.]
PLLDRIDLQVEVTPVGFQPLAAPQPAETSATIRRRVVAARQQQAQRFDAHANVHCNAQMTPRQVHERCRIDESSQALLKTAMERLGLSARAYDRILRVSRTIADMSGCDDIGPEHVAEAIQFRSLDRDSWAG